MGTRNRAEAAERWRVAMNESYEHFREAVALAERFGGEAPWLDAYATTHPAEFFAVCSESFFTDPLRLRDTYPAVYEQFVLFFGQQPATRFPATRLLAGEPELQG